MPDSKIFAGVDVSKSQLDAALRPGGEAESFANDTVGVAALVAWLCERKPELVVLEATGGFEALIAGELASHLAVAVVNPRQVRDFAKALGKLAKTDRIDAAVLAHFAEAVRPEARPLATEEQALLEALLTR